MKTRVATTKEYTITFRALPDHHKLFAEYVKRFFHTESLQKYGELKMEAKSL